MKEKTEGSVMVRFFVDPAALEQESILLTGENARHAKVLRMKSGEQLLLCDGRGQELLCAVAAEQSGEGLRLEPIASRPAQAEPAVQVRVYMAFPKAEKLEHVIQKATELGACEIVAFPAIRCVSRPDVRALGKKIERWQRIATAAAEQSGRGRIPGVRVADSFREAMEEAAQGDKALLLYEQEHSLTLKAALAGGFSTVSLVTGPEGGFEEQEVAQAQAAGLQVCTLGRRILRCETAPLCALSAVMYEAGEF